LNELVQEGKVRFIGSSNFSAAQVEEAQRVSSERGLARFVTEQYGGKAERIWLDTKDPAELLARLRALPGYGPQKAQIFLAILGKRLNAAPPGWEELAGAYGLPGHRSIADVDGPGAVDQVRSYKQEQKKKARA